MAGNPSVENMMSIIVEMKKETDVLKTRLQTERRRRIELDQNLQDYQERNTKERLMNEEIENDNSNKSSMLEVLKSRIQESENLFQQKKNNVEDLEAELQKYKEDMENEKLSYENKFEESLQKFKDLKRLYSPEGIEQQSHQLKAESEMCNQKVIGLEACLSDAKIQLENLKTELRSDTDNYGLTMREKNYVMYIFEECNSKLQGELDELNNKIKEYSSSGDKDEFYPQEIYSEELDNNMLC